MANNPFDINYATHGALAAPGAVNPNAPGILNQIQPAGYVNGVSTTNNGGGGGGGGGGGASTPLYTAPVDPYSADQHSFLDSMGNSIATIGGNAGSAFGTANRSLQGNAEGLFNKVSTGQKAITRGRENVELNRLNGMHDILGFVRRGLQQGSSRLGAMNATESSGAEGLARAYSEVGNEKAQGVSNDAFMAGRDIDTQQEALDLEKTQGQKDFSRLKDEQTQSITNQVWQQLMDLNTKASSLKLAGVDVEAKKNEIINGGIKSLNDVDAWLKGQLGGVSAATSDTVKATAQNLRAQGMGGTNPFQIDYDPLNGGTSPAGADPLFTGVRFNKKQL